MLQLLLHRPGAFAFPGAGLLWCMLRKFPIQTWP